MKKLALLAIVLMATGCATRTIYVTQIRISPAAQKGQYLIEAAVTEHQQSMFSQSGRSMKLPVTPVYSGTEASIQGEGGAGRLSLKAYIPAADEKKQATCFVEIQRDGHTLSLTELSLPLRGE